MSFYPCCYWLKDLRQFFFAYINIRIFMIQVSVDKDSKSRSCSYRSLSIADASLLRGKNRYLYRIFYLVRINFPKTRSKFWK